MTRSVYALAARVMLGAALFASNRSAYEEKLCHSKNLTGSLCRVTT
jgi:hypothetical protein